MPFSEQYAPKLFTDAPAPARYVPMHKRDLLDVYLGNDIRPLQQDADTRRDHYTSEQHEVLERLGRGEDVDKRLRSELLMQFMRRTEPARLEHKVKAKISKEPLEEVKAPAFEEQDLFQGAIKIL